MSYIVRRGNLAGLPELKQGPQREYAHARVLVTDSERNRETGEFEDTGTIGYDLTVFGADAKNLVATAQESGNVRVLFSGDYKVKEFQRKDGGQGISHRVTVDEIGISLSGQHVTVQKAAKKPATAEPEDDYQPYWPEPATPDNR